MSTPINPYRCLRPAENTVTVGLVTQEQTTTTMLNGPDGPVPIGTTVQRIIADPTTGNRTVAVTTASEAALDGRVLTEKTPPVTCATCSRTPLTAESVATCHGCGVLTCRRYCGHEHETLWRCPKCWRRFQATRFLRWLTTP